MIFGIFEKLILHVLIVLVPIILYLMIYEGQPKKRKNIVLICFMSIAAILCVMYPFHDNGLLWDLRYVPIVIAFMYGNRTAGLTVTGIVLLVRVYQGGDMIVYGVIGLIINSIIFLLLTHLVKEKVLQSNRLKISMFGILIPIGLQLMLALVKLVREGTFQSDIDELLVFSGVYTSLILFSMFIAASLYEMFLKRERMQDELLYAVRQQSISELSASIAHEVRNPLTVVKGFLQLMKEDDTQAKQEYYQLILSELNRAENIIHEYLTLSKPQLGESLTVPMKECLVHTITLLTPYAFKEGVLLKELKTNEQEAFVFTDRSKLKQAIINFLKNAIEASAPSGEVEVTMNVNKQFVEVEIRDTGKGMSKEELAKIGTVYYSTKEEGTGLGTMVSIRLIEEMGGKILYESEVNKGTTVQIVLPLKTDNE
ncbi:ATP-binding protein [Alkalihalobacillus sp. FSL W8-0930]